MPENLFYGEGGMSDLMRHYVAGLVANLPELTAVFCPTINSYKRTVPGAWAPVNATWGVDNRTTAVRAIPGSRKSTRVELRLTGADINPYLAMAASLAAGIDGIERQLELSPPTVNAYYSSQENNINFPAGYFQPPCRTPRMTNAMRALLSMAMVWRVL